MCTTQSQTVRVPPEHAIIPPNGGVAPHAPTPPIVHGPHDLSALCSGTKNPWGSIWRQRNHSHSPHNWTTLCLDSPSPQGSLRNFNHCCCSYSPRQHHTELHPDLVQHSASHPWHPEQLQPSRDWSLHSKLHSHALHSELPLRNPQQYSPSTLSSHQYPIPVHILQVIQHPHGISPTILKITKTIPAIPTKIQKKNMYSPLRLRQHYTDI
jgi:hypothetical protein